MTEFPNVQGKSAVHHLTEAVRDQNQALLAVDADLTNVTKSLTRAWNKIGALWVFAAGGYITGLAGILLAVLT